MAKSKKKQPYDRKVPRRKPKKRPPPVTRDPGQPPPPGVAPEDVPLTHLERAFIMNYFLDENGTRAYKETHVKCPTYAAAGVRACELLQKPHIQKELKATGEALMVKFEVNAEDAIQEVLRIAFSDLFYVTDAKHQHRNLRDIPLHARRAIQSVKVRREKTVFANKKKVVTEQILEYKMYDKAKALDRICTLLGLKTTIPELEAVLALMPRSASIKLRAMIVEAQRNNDTAQIEQTKTPTTVTETRSDL